MMRFVSALLLFVCSLSPALAQERQWSFDQTDKDAYLVFGVPETDDVGLSFWCTQRSGWITLFLPESDPALKPGRKTKVNVYAGGRRFRFEGATTANQEAGNISIEVRLKPDDRLFASLAEADRIRIVAGKSEHVFPLQEVDLATLLQLCAKS